MKYTIVWAHDSSDLELKVNSLMVEGWQPIGGLAAMAEHYNIDGIVDNMGFIDSNVNRITYLYQAMIREELGD